MAVTVPPLILSPTINCGPKMLSEVRREEGVLPFSPSWVRKLRLREEALWLGLTALRGGWGL